MSEEYGTVVMTKSTQKWLKRKGMSESKRSEIRRKKRPFHDEFSLKKD